MSSVGRGVISKKWLVDEALKLDLTQMRRLGLFGQQNGRIHECSWSLGDERVARIGLSFSALSEKASALTLFYTVSPGRRQETEDLNYRVLLTTTPCHFGNRRFWFICPLIKEGWPCRRRCRILYLPHGEIYFGCRECHELTYESRQRHRDRFYEGLSKPFDVLDRAGEKLMRARTPKAAKYWGRQIENADAALQAFLGRNKW